MRGKVTVASVLIGVAAASACSDEDTKKNAKGDPDAGADGSLAGDGGSAGSSAGGTGATGGIAGTGGTGGTGAGGAGGSAGMDASAGTGGTAGSGGTAGTGAAGTSGGTGGTGGVMLICNTLDAGATGGSAGQGTGGTGGVLTGIAGMGPGGSTATADAGVAGAATGGAAGSAGAGTGGSAGSGPVAQWRDWDAYQCRDCPTGLTSDCVDFESGTSTFDRSTKILTVHVKPGLTEVVSATYEFYWDAPDPDGGFQSATETGSMIVDKNTLTLDLSALPADFYMYSLRFYVTDACGATQRIDYGIENQVGDGDSGVQVNLHCEGF